MFSYKSFQYGLLFSIIFNFHALFHFFIPAFAGTGSVFLFGSQIPRFHELHTKPDGEHCISGCETVHQIVSMLVYTLNKIRGHSCIQGAIPFAAKKVNIKLFQGLSLDSRLPGNDLIAIL